MLREEIFEELQNIELLDVHTHIDASHLSARGLHDILLYHMVISDLYSAGYKVGSRLSEDPEEDEITFRIGKALDYLPYVQNTSSMWGMRLILKELYGWEKPIDKDNWRQLHNIIKERAKDPAWPREILKKAKISRLSTELWRGRSGKADDILQYSLEWAFFARCQWGQYDTALLELEHAWGVDEPGAPLPVNIEEGLIEISRSIRNLEDVKKAILHYCDKIPYEKVLSTAQHISTDINYCMVSDEEMEKALNKREVAGEKEKDIYASYILEAFLTELEKRGKNIVFQFSFGAEPLPFETGCKLKSDTVYELANILQRHPGISFQVFLACEHQSQSICTLAREYPNLSVAGYWWHNFFPGSIKKIISQRLDMMPANKQVGFFSDAYCVDWAYAKSIIVRNQFADILASKIEQHQYTKEQAVSIAKQVMFEAPKTLLGMKPGIKV